MPDEFKDLLRELRSEVHALRQTWRRLLIVAVVAVLIVIFTLAGFGAYFIIGTRHAVDRSNQAIADVNQQADVQAKALRCIENYENARRDRDMRVLHISTIRNRALDARNLAEDAALNAAIAHEPHSRVLHLAHIYSKKSRIYRRATHHYYKVLAANPIPKIRKFRCAEQAFRRTPPATSTPPAPAPTVTVTRTPAAPAPSTVTVPGPTVTVTAHTTRTVYAPPGKAHTVTVTRSATVTVTANPLCTVVPGIPTC